MNNLPFSKIFHAHKSLRLSKCISTSSLLALLASTSMSHAAGFESNQHSFDLHGYFRATLASAAGGDTSVQYKLFDTKNSSGRLGNEPHLFGDLTFAYEFDLDGGEKTHEDSAIKFFATLNGIQFNGDSNTTGNIGSNNTEARFIFNGAFDNLTELVFKMENTIGETADIWFGRHYYQRKTAYMIDYNYLNLGQGAEAMAGIEQITVPGGHLDLAIARSERANAGPQADLTLITPGNEAIENTTFDARYNIVGKDGDNLMLIGQYGTRHGNNNVLQPRGLAGETVDSKDGFAAGVLWTKGNIMGGRNDLFVMYRTGATIQPFHFNSPAVFENDLGGVDLDEVNTFEILNDLVIEPSKSFAMQVVGVYHQTETGVNGDGSAAQADRGDKITWMGIGARPVWFLSDHVSIAFETNYDTVENEKTGLDGDLWKNTIALQLSKGRGYWNRPSFRAYVTNAQFSGDANGGNSIDSGTATQQSCTVDDDSCTSIGLQVEAWW